MIVPEAAPELLLWRVERILFDEAGLLVVDKPAHVPVHGGDESLEHSLVQRLSTFLRACGRRPYLGVHSRLDQETSGALLLTTDEARNAEVAQASENHAIRRTYHAVVECGSNARLRDSGRIELLLEHHKERSEVVQRGGKRAVTHYKIVRSAGNRALVELELETGRTHQIRVSLAHLGASVVGDTLYGGAAGWRLFLHASRLEGGPLPQAVQSPLPYGFESALNEVTGSDGRSPQSLTNSQISHLLRDAASLRAPLVQKNGAFRLFNGAGDGISGLVIDGYGKRVVVNLYEDALETSVPLIGEVLAGLGYETGYVKRRVRRDLRGEDATQLAPEVPVWGAPVSQLIVDEGGLRVAINLTDGLSTGLFIDQRDNRDKARGWARGGKMLNLFCYTASFSVAAALGGARTVSVDVSGRALSRGRVNFELNRLSLDGHQFIKDDAMKILGRAVRRGDRYDFIVLDPPSFATVGKGTFSVKSRYVEAAEQCLRLLAPGGRLLAVTNHTATPHRAFRRMLHEAAERAGISLVSLKDLPSSLDCPDGPDGPWPSKSLLATVP